MADRVVDPHRLLSRGELQFVLHSLRWPSWVVANRLPGRNGNRAANRILFRLAACCGLRVGEISTLRCADVVVHGPRPHLVIRAQVAKRRKRRSVPLWWDEGTFRDVDSWLRMRLETMRCGATAAFLCSLDSRWIGEPICVRALQHRWRTAIKILGPERVAQLSIHCGRHTFLSHALHGGRTLAEVRDAAGHSSIATTSIYLHALTEDTGFGNLFGAPGSPPDGARERYRLRPPADAVDRDCPARTEIVHEVGGDNGSGDE